MAAKRFLVLGCTALVMVAVFLVISCLSAGNANLPHWDSGDWPPGHHSYNDAPNPNPRGWENRPGQWELVWRDEFNGTELNLDNWNIETGTGAQFGTTGTGSPFGLAGWGNYEAQYYRKDNVSVRNGMLVIEARNDGHVGSWWQHYPLPAGAVQREMPFTSGKVTTGGTRASNTYCALHSDCTGIPDCAGCVLSEKFSISEGFIEARIRAPRGEGFWPAFWTLGTNANRYGNGGSEAHVAWPRSGEIDIMEMRGGQEYLHVSTIHHGMSFPYRRWFPGNTLDVRNVLPQGVDMANGFHVYGVWWDENNIHFYFNGWNWFSIDLRRLQGGPSANAAAFTYHLGQFININLAVGGNFIQRAEPGPALFAASASPYDRSLMVDWIRVYRKVGGNSVVRIHGEVIPCSGNNAGLTNER